MKNRRKKIYTDFDIQGKLVVFLILMETLLMAGAIVYLYIDFQSIIENHLYSAHFASKDALFQQFVIAFVHVIIAVVLINLIALWLTHIIWSKHIDTILSTFRQILQNTSKLNLSAAGTNGKARHFVLRFLSSWLTLERNRSFRLRALCSRMDDRADLALIRSSTSEIQRLLKANPLFFREDESNEND